MGVVSLNPTVNSRAEQYNKNTALGKDDFLKLLVTQLRYQDPLNPMNSTEFTAQLAQFSALEQQKNTNTNLEKLLSKQDLLTQVSLSGLMGKDVLAFSNEVFVEDAKAMDLSFELPQDVKSTTVTITDQSGRLVRTLVVSGGKKGLNSVTWDGKNSSGAPVAQGKYYFTVSGTLTDKSTVAGQPCAKGKVEEIGYEQGIPYLYVGGRKIALGQVVKITEPKGDKEGGGSE